MEKNIERLKVNCFDRIEKDILSGEDTKKNLIIRIKFLEDQLDVIKNEKLKNDNSANKSFNEYTKTNLSRERCKTESKYINKEIPLLKNKIDEVLLLMIDSKTNRNKRQWYKQSKKRVYKRRIWIDKSKAERGITSKQCQWFNQRETKT